VYSKILRPGGTGAMMLLLHLHLLLLLLLLLPVFRLIDSLDYA
jgi:hypothetical protein